MQQLTLLDMLNKIFLVNNKNPRSIYFINSYKLMVNYMSHSTENMGDTLIKLIDKLAGKGSDIKLSFQDLTLDTGLVKVNVNGSIVLDVLYVADKK